MSVAATALDRTKKRVEHLRNRFDCLSMVHSEEFYAQGLATGPATVGGHASVHVARLVGVAAEAGEVREGGWPLVVAVVLVVAVAGVGRALKVEVAVGVQVR